MATFKDCLFDGGVRNKAFVDRTNNQQYKVLDFYSAVVSGFDMAYMDIRYIGKEYEEIQEEDWIDEFGNHFRGGRNGKKLKWRDVKCVVSSLDDVCVE